MPYSQRGPTATRLDSKVPAAPLREAGEHAGPVLVLDGDHRGIRGAAHAVADATLRHLWAFGDEGPVSAVTSLIAPTRYCARSNPCDSRSPRTPLPASALTNRHVRGPSGQEE